MRKLVHDLQPDVALDEAEAGLIGALSLDGADGERSTPDQARIPEARAGRSDGAAR
jgi:hypothetical protein